jgi:predicted RecB family nuclease
VIDRVVTASDFYTYYRPSKCDLRVWLRSIAEPEADPSPYERVIRRLGELHEQNHLHELGAHLDLAEGDRADRRQRTFAAVRGRAPVIYQPALEAQWSDGSSSDWTVRGDPDYLLLQDDGYVIRDSKVSRRITEAAHPEIVRQLTLYGWLFQEFFGQSPKNLEVHSGTGQIVSLGLPDRDRMFDDLRRIAAWKASRAEFYTPVGWTKCGRCPLHYRCWPKAVEANDVALVVGVDRNLATQLREEGVSTVQDLIDGFEATSLQEFRYPWGSRTRKVGASAESILRMGQALLDSREIVFDTPSVPWYSDYVMFDLEGIPAQLDQLEKVYLWGLQVFGEHGGEYVGTIADAGHDGDRKGWFDFLESADKVFEDHGDIPFVHWHHYERVRLDMYLERFGDRGRVARRVRRNLLDLLPLTQSSVAVPLPSYSLKVIEQYVGFRRTLEEANGDWAMATYIEATETEDETRRNELFQQVLGYNREDLAATWTVLSWLRGIQTQSIMEGDSSA